MGRELILNRMQKKVLFISHEASRTGAPIVLLHFLEWLKSNSTIPFEILIKSGAGADGEMLSAFQALAPVTILNDLAPYNSAILPRVVRKLGFDQGTKEGYRKRLNESSNGEFGLVYSNTVANGEVLDWLSELHVPVITHVHELDYAIRIYAGVEPFRHVLRRSDCFIAVSDAVKRNLIEHHGVAAEKIALVHEFVSAQKRKTRPGFRLDLLLDLSMPPDTLVVGGAGTIDWRKGCDMFVQVAKAIKSAEATQPVCFLWIGGPTQGLYYEQLCYDLERLELQKDLRIIGLVENPLEYMAALDVFVLTSREDAFPLVCLEAASLGKPIVCFDRAGGAPELVEQDCGFVVPYLNIDAMAKKVALLLNSEEMRRSLGRRGAEKVMQRYDVAVSAPKILDVIRRFI